MKKSLPIKFGEYIRKKRKESGLSQEKFAEKVAVHRTYVGMIERAEKNITLINIKKFAIGLGVSISTVFKEIDE